MQLAFALALRAVAHGNEAAATCHVAAGEGRVLKCVSNLSDAEWLSSGCERANGRGGRKSQKDDQNLNCSPVHMIEPINLLNRVSRAISH